MVFKQFLTVMASGEQLRNFRLSPDNEGFL